MENRNVVKSILSIIFAAATFFVVVYFLYFLGFRSSQSSYEYEFTDGWMIAVNEDKVYEDVDLTSFVFEERIHSGDKIVLRNTLPRTVVSACSARILLYLSSVEVKVDGHLVYTYGYIDQLKGHFIGSGYHFASLPADAAGKEIEITIYPNATAAFTSIPKILLIASGYTMNQFFREHVLSIFCGIFLFMLGLIITVASIVAHSKNSIYRGLIHIGVFSLNIGAWTLCNSKVMQIYSMNYSVNTGLEYFSLYFSIPSMIAFLITMRQDGKRWKDMVLKGLFLLTLGYAVVTFLLHMSGIIYYPSTVTLFHVLSIFSVFVVIIAGLKPWHDMNIEEKVLNIGLIEIFFFGIIDVFRFNIQKYLVPDNEFLSQSVLPIGTIIFIIFLLVSYIVYIYSKALTINEKKTLTKMAFQDQLTGLYNRAEADRLFIELDAAVTPYAIINMDLNGLKATNDIYGHAMGDLLLQKFSGILLSSFSEIGTCIRMGGDEFLVVILDYDRERINRCIKHMEELERTSSASLKFTISAAYGIAYSDEDDLQSSEKVYQLADRRMYERKESMKQGR